MTAILSLQLGIRALRSFLQQNGRTSVSYSKTDGRQLWAKPRDNFAVHVNLGRRTSAAPKLGGFPHKDVDQHFGGHLPGKRGCLT